MSVTSIAQQSYQASVKGAVNPGVLADMQASPVALFRVRGGIVLMTQLIGQVRAAPTNAVVPIITFDPDVGAAVAVATIMVSIAALPIGRCIQWAGTVGAPAPIAGAAVGMVAPGETTMVGNFVIMVPGILYFTNAVVDTTGIIDWYINYIPAYPGAFVEPY